MSRNNKNYIFVIVVSLISLIVFMPSVFATANPAYNESYADYSPVNFVSLNSPFLTSAQGTQIEYPVNEKYQQPRLWASNGSTNDTHEGVDISSGFGTPVYQVWNGKVVYVSPAGTSISQNYVVVQLDTNLDGQYTEELYAVYMHMSTISVSTGPILKGALIGKSGYYGSQSSGSHLHFGLTKNSSSSYLQLVWTPLYNFYKTSSLYNYGKDLDFIYNMTGPDAGVLKVSGYHKPNSTTTRNSLESMTLYTRPYYNPGSPWVGTPMTSIGNFTYSKDLNSLGYSKTTVIQYFVVGKAANSGSWTAKVGYYPPKFYIPPTDPNSWGWTPNTKVYVTN